MIDGFSQKSFGNTAYDRWISEKSFAMATLNYVASRTLQWVLLFLSILLVIYPAE